tara:strand:- start:911 stop:1531 length:621 start_codon:yes stop_codon:yes gene_type:complete
MAIYLARHGQTDWNSQHRVMGHADVLLNRTGREQATEVAASVADLCYVRGIRISNFLLFSSDLRRCIETAWIVESLIKAAVPWDIDIDETEYTTLLREMNLGEWEGKKHSEVIDAEKYGDCIMSYLCIHKPDFVIPGGESVIQFVQRVKEAACNLIENTKHEDALVITHSGVIRVLQCNFDIKVIPIAARPKNGEVIEWTPEDIMY